MAPRTTMGMQSYWFILGLSYIFFFSPPVPLQRLLDGMYRNPSYNPQFWDEFCRYRKLNLDKFGVTALECGTVDSSRFISSLLFPYKFSVSTGFQLYFNKNKLREMQTNICIYTATSVGEWVSYQACKQEVRGLIPSGVEVFVSVLEIKASLSLVKTIEYLL